MIFSNIKILYLVFITLKFSMFKLFDEDVNKFNDYT